MLILSAFTVQAKCDWSKVYLAYGNTCNVYKFEVAGTVDSCYLTRTIITNRKTAHKDTFYGRGFSVTFADTGKYNVFVKVYNKCLMCDTGFEKLIYVTCKPTNNNKCDWSKIGFYYNNKCETVVFEMGSKDTCISYTTWRYNHKTGKLDTLAHDRVFTRTMDTGLYSFKTSFHNKCCGGDTFIYKERVHITCEDSTGLGISEIEKPTIKFHPNPTYDYIEVEYSGTPESLQFYDESGKLVYVGKTTDRNIDTQRWSPGIYTIKAGKLINRIVVRH